MSFTLHLLALVVLQDVLKSLAAEFFPIQTEQGLAHCN